MRGTHSQPKVPFFCFFEKQVPFWSFRIQPKFHSIHGLVFHFFFLLQLFSLGVLFLLFDLNRSCLSTRFSTNTKHKRLIINSMVLLVYYSTMGPCQLIGNQWAMSHSQFLKGSRVNSNNSDVEGSDLCFLSLFIISFVLVYMMIYTQELPTPSPGGRPKGVVLIYLEPKIEY